jgi:hypothetical protein
MADRSNFSAPSDGWTDIRLGTEIAAALRSRNKAISVGHLAMAASPHFPRYKCANCQCVVK